MLYEVITASGRIIDQSEEIPIRALGEDELSISSVSTDPVRVQEGIVITSYSIHYTKLYELYQPHNRLNVPYQTDSLFLRPYI